ncbi:tetratricopeptide repeat protein [Streptomyces sp. NPDC020362]|uniref:tetratricopeptide repeat protein n=1 Tax=unclassified Streptomyces TaxID=2593676 RepID=UPI00340F2ADA
MPPRPERADLGGRPLPRCTSSTIALANLGHAQLVGLAQHYAQSGHTDVGVRLTNALLARHSITSDACDLMAADRITTELVSHAPADSTAWLTRAHVATTTHRFAESAQALALATHHGDATEDLAEERADVLEACGRGPAALRLRPAHGTTHVEPQQMARIACLHVSMGNDQQARDAFGEALGRYTSPSPLPLAAILYNWGHALQHAGQHDRAVTAYRAVLAYFPTHARALRALTA